MDEEYMKIALTLAGEARGLTNPNPMVGAVIVKNGKIIGKGYHKKCGENHAEVNAFNSATESVEGAVMYVTLEPCSHYGKTPPCADKIIEKRIGRVVVAMLDPNPLVAGRGIEKIRAAGIEVKVGVLENEAMKLNEVFLKYIITKEPFVHLKTAMSLDGKIATSSGESRWISSIESRNEVHNLRAYYSGIMVGVQTVIKDDPELTCRNSNGTNPIRIIIDSRLRIPLDVKVLTNQSEAKTIIATTQNADSTKFKELSERSIQIITVPEYKGKVCLKSLMKELGKQNIDSILLEGGATLNFSALEEEIVDKVSAYIAPIFIGGESSPTPIGGSGINKLAEGIKLTNMKCSTIGKDIKIEGYIEKSKR